jgi:mono/diheme cytochrome c family protein
MKTRFIAMVIAGWGTFALHGAALAADTDDALGKGEFQTRCAMCHGMSGHGDGWLAKYLLQRPPSLTQLKKNNGGVFPLVRVNDIIYGRQPVKLHGPSEMPVWGDIYREEQQRENLAQTGVASVDERVIRAKIRALTGYVSQLQE